MVRKSILQQELALGIMKLQWVVRLDILHCIALGIQNLLWAVRTGIFVVRTGIWRSELALGT